MFEEQLKKYIEKNIVKTPPVSPLTKRKMGIVFPLFKGKKAAVETQPSPQDNVLAMLRALLISDNPTIQHIILRCYVERMIATAHLPKDMQPCIPPLFQEEWARLIGELVKDPQKKWSNEDIIARRETLIANLPTDKKIWLQNCLDHIKPFLKHDTAYTALSYVIVPESAQKPDTITAVTQELNALGRLYLSLKPLSEEMTLNTLAGKDGLFLHSLAPQLQTVLLDNLTKQCQSPKVDFAVFLASLGQYIGSSLSLFKDLNGDEKKVIPHEQSVAYKTMRKTLNSNLDTLFLDAKDEIDSEDIGSSTFQASKSKIEALLTDKDIVGYSQAAFILYQDADMKLWSSDAALEEEKIFFKALATAIIKDYTLRKLNDEPDTPAKLDQNITEVTSVISSYMQKKQTRFFDILQLLIARESRLIEPGSEPHLQHVLTRLEATMKPKKPPVPEDISFPPAKPPLPGTFFTSGELDSVLEESKYLSF